MENEAPVLIAGGGLTGLAAAAFLAQQGIRSIAVERLPQSSPLPRAAFFHMRTMEMFRELGIEARVREESAKEFVPDGALIAMDCIAAASSPTSSPISTRAWTRSALPPLVPQPAAPRTHPARTRARRAAPRCCRARRSPPCARTRRA
jgi:2-polyprenyl-6-methoxyphenol hydroxylase-like FAD-dependent oxidoreductase